MNGKHLSASLLGALILLLSGCSGNEDPNIVITGLKATVAETINGCLEANQSDKEPGLSILVRKDGEQDHFLAGGSMDGFEFRLVIEPARNLEFVALSNGGQLTLRHIGNIYSLISKFYGQSK